MTTLRDLLNDFQKDTIRIVEENPVKYPSDQLVLGEELDSLIEEYTEIIKERFVG